jgi:hypothetical protein
MASIWEKEAVEEENRIGPEEEPQSQETENEAVRIEEDASEQLHPRGWKGKKGVQPKKLTKLARPKQAKTVVDERDASSNHQHLKRFCFSVEYLTPSVGREGNRAIRLYKVVFWGNISLISRSMFDSFPVPHVRNYQSRV